MVAGPGCADSGVNTTRAGKLIGAAMETFVRNGDQISDDGGRSFGDRNTQPATGHSPSSDVVNMMRPSATQAAP
jgi:hypothetical protein